MTDPYNTVQRSFPLDTIEFQLSEAMRVSLAAAKIAHDRGDIKQREVSPGVYILVRKEPCLSGSHP